MSSKIGMLVAVAVLSGNALAVKPTALFSAPTCSIAEQRARLAESVRNEVRPSGDGHVPWLGLVGTWVDETRGVVVHFETEPFSNDTFGIGRVTVRSLCTDEVLARGGRLVTEEDLDAAAFEVVLRVYKDLRHSQISVILDRKKDLTGRAMRVRFRRQDLILPRVVDEFWLLRP